jgi:hypothetical protein
VLPRYLLIILLEGSGSKLYSGFSLRKILGECQQPHTVVSESRDLDFSWKGVNTFTLLRGSVRQVFGKCKHWLAKDNIGSRDLDFGQNHLRSNCITMTRRELLFV